MDREYNAPRQPMTIDVLKENLWSQFAASIDMLKNAIVRQPDERWFADKKFFYMSYHVLFFLEIYLTFPAPEDYKPKLPYRSVDLDMLPAEAIDDLLPENMYSKQEILGYVDTCREMCRKLIAGLTEEKIRNERWMKDGRSFAILEMMMYNMRHVQHHAAQLNMMLRQSVNDAPRWVSRPKDPLSA